MPTARLPRGAQRVIVLAIGAVSLLVGCSVGSGASDAGASITALRITMPVHEPQWSQHGQALFALTGDRRIAKVTPAAQSTMLSALLPDVGEDLVTRITAGVVYVPQPHLGRVALISDTDLRQVGTLQAGPSPSYLSLDSGSNHLLALSEDRTTVTPVDLHTNTAVPAEHVQARAPAEIGGAKRGRRIDYHIAGPEGITHHQGDPDAVDVDGVIGIPAEKTTGDLTKPSRLYVAEKGTDRLLAIETNRSLHGLHIIAQTDLGEPVRYLGVDDTRLYAATEHALAVFSTNSFEGYPDQTFPLLSRINFRSALPPRVRNAELSGLAVSPDRIYLTLKDEPYIVGIAKPDM